MSGTPCLGRRLMAGLAAVTGGGVGGGGRGRPRGVGLAGGEALISGSAARSGVGASAAAAGLEPEGEAERVSCSLMAGEHDGEALVTDLLVCHVFGRGTRFIRLVGAG